MKDNNPISPHIQVYHWHISSLVSISHRITGVINYLLLIIIDQHQIMFDVIGRAQGPMAQKNRTDGRAGRFFVGPGPMGPRAL